MKLEMPQKAVVWNTQAIKLDSGLAMAYFNRALAEQKINDFNASVIDFRIAIRHKYKVAESLKGIGYSFLGQRKTDEAIEFLNQAINLKPDFAQAYYYKAFIQHSLKNYEEALINYDLAVRYDPNYGIAFYNRGLLKMAMKNKEGACGDFSASLKLNHKEALMAIKKYCN